MSKCVVCQKNVTFTYHLCSKCSKKYGALAKERPPWLNFLINDNQRIRRQERKIQDKEITFSDLSRKQRIILGEEELVEVG